MRRCPSCDGVIGVDCFNPEECAQIGYQQEMQRQHQQEQMGASILDRLAALEERVYALESKLAATEQQKGEDK